MYDKILLDFINEIRENHSHRTMLLKNPFYVMKKFTISSPYRTLIPRNTKGLYAFIEEKDFKTKNYNFDFIIRYIGRSNDIQKRLLEHEKQINIVLTKLNKGISEKGKYFLFAKEMLQNPKKYSVYIWRWSNPRPIHNDVFNDREISIENAEGILGGLAGEVFGNKCFNRDFITRSVWALEKPNLNFIENYSDLKQSDKLDSINNLKLLDLWREWNNKYIKKRKIPLFEATSKWNEIKIHELSGESIRVCRSFEMEELVSKEVEKVFNAFTNSPDNFDYDGLIYLVYTYGKYVEKKKDIDLIFDEDIIPIYIGKTETIGRNGTYSVNIKNVHKKQNKKKFARWGDGNDYHIGDLSNVLLPNKLKPQKKYQKWAEFFFEPRNKQSLDPIKLRFPIFFWIKAWHKNDNGIIMNLPCSIPFLERQIITLTSMLYPNFILNIS